MKAAITVAMLASASWAAADEVWLKNGGRVVGEVVDRRPTAVVLDVGPGTVTLPMARVEKIVTTTSALSEFRSRAGRLAPSDLQGWMALARWAQANDLRTQALEAWQHVAAVDPSNTVAQQALGNVFQAGQWMEHAAAMRAQGLVQFEGDWVTPTEMEFRIRQRSAEEAARMQAAEADARVAEAEARAREAEARAAAAEADAARTIDGYNDGGIPLDYVYGAGGFIVGGFPIQPCCGLRHANGFCPNHGRGGGRGNVGPVPQPPPPAPAPAPPPRDGNGSRRPTATPVNRRTIG